jgi:hypothetical protein
MVRPVVTASVPACRRRPSGGAPAAGPRCPSASKGCSGGISGWSGAAGAGGGVQHRDGGLRALPAVARQVEDQLRHVVQRLDVRPRLGAGVVGGLDDPEVHAVVPGRPAAGHGERGGVLRGAVPQRRKQPLAERRRGRAVVGLGVDPPDRAVAPVPDHLVARRVPVPAIGVQDALRHAVQVPADGVGGGELQPSAAVAAPGLRVPDPDGAAVPGRDQHGAVAVRDDLARPGSEAPGDVGWAS